LSDEKIQRIPKLLKMLADAGHHTPFEKSSLHFLVDTDIASHIHLLKHRVGVSINGESARYKEIKEDKYLIPNDWEGIESNFVDEDDNMLGVQNDKWTTILKDYTELGNTLYHQCLKDLEPVLGRKRAKESARFFKTYNSQIQADIMFNWRSFFHFLELRNKPDAQKEIREIASLMLKLVKEIEGNPFEHTIAAFNL
jgi:flavin-dependent thymidylate synthase